MASDTAPARRRGRPRATAEEVEARRQKLIRAAYEVFLDKGYHATSVADITARAGLGFGTYYKAFTNKREILDPVIDFGVEQILSEILQDVTTDAATFAEYEQQFRTFAARINAAFTERPRLAKFLMFEATTVDEEITRRWQGVIELGVSLIAGYLEDGVHQGILRADLATDETARAILGIILMAVMQTAYGLTEPRQNDEYIDAALALISDGTRGRS
ncbi:TetR/AcrR family transcriptional regulator [Mycobacterium hubeiense]|uniref:TetR/AcrR family transcriptional regulator n=1 Tax=Mycobacterium hubeiense TaxID=1867256 RepID=UPI0013042A07|nr:TetR/AcrR family transcriptional regulator [Mycobacterium sp. QGD 101]